MIASLVPQVAFAPVPHVEISITDSETWDGGGAAAPGAGSLSGGSPSSTGSSEVDAGNPGIMAVELPAGTDTVTLWWMSEGVSDMVPGAIQRPISSLFGHLDVEAGFDVTTAYEIECFAGSQNLGRVPIGSVVLPWEGDDNECLIQQPLNPYLNALVTNMEGSWPSLTREAPGELVRVQGAVFPTLVGSGPRRAAQDVALHFAVSSREAAQRVRATLGTQADPQLPVWLVRSHHGILPRRFYGHVASLTESDGGVTGDEVWTEFTSTVSEIARPAPGLQVSPLSYTDLDVSYPSYTERDSAYASYDEMDTDWALSGASG